MRFWPVVTSSLIAFSLIAQRGPSKPPDPAAIEVGRQLYLGSCSGCHGATGEGSQGPSLLSGRVSRLPDRTLYNSIKNGLPGTTMPNFDLPDAKLRQLTAFLRSLTAPAFTMPAAGDVARGKALFFGTAKCSSCHMILGEGGYPGPDLSNIAAERTLPQLRESILSPALRVEAGFRPATVTLTSGRTIQGIAKNFNNYSVQIMDKSGRLHSLDRASVAKLEIKDAATLMPPANTADATDLIAFLARQSTRPVEGPNQ